MSTENYIISFPSYEARDAFCQAVRNHPEYGKAPLDVSRFVPTVVIHDVPAAERSHLEALAGDDASILPDETFALHD